MRIVENEMENRSISRFEALADLALDKSAGLREGMLRF